jgi:hypothetical protein
VPVAGERFAGRQATFEDRWLDGDVIADIYRSCDEVHASMSVSVWTKRSIAASDTIADGKTAGTPRGVHRLP